MAEPPPAPCPFLSSWGGKRETPLAQLMPGWGGGSRSPSAGTEHPAAQRCCIPGLTAAPVRGSHREAEPIAFHQRRCEGGGGYFCHPGGQMTADPLPCCSRPLREHAGQERRGVFASWSWAQRPAPLWLQRPQQSREPLGPDLGNNAASPRASLDPSIARPCRQPGASFAPCLCALRRFLCEFPLPGACVTSGSLCRSLSKCWSTAQLFLI